MRTIFWLNSLSPHQLPYIIHFIEDKRIDHVVIVADYINSDIRKNMGWDTNTYPNLEKCEVHIHPSQEIIKKILEHQQEYSIHLFSGIRAFKFIFNVFILSLNYNLKRGIITERPYTFAFGLANGKPLWLHRLRFIIQDRKFIPYIHYIFAMGESATNYYRSLSKQWNVYPFAYCTQEHPLKEVIKEVEITQSIRFIFIGNFSSRKAVIDILKAYHYLKNSQINKKCIEQITIDLIGDGPEYIKLQQYTSKKNLSKYINFWGTRKNSEIPSLLEQEDILILPSIYDGWGAVINEALSKGLYVICSDKCGAKELLNNLRCGCTFKAGNYKQLARRMKDCIEDKNRIKKDAKFRAEWALRCISGQTIAKYMIDCLSGEKAMKPWISEQNN